MDAVFSLVQGELALLVKESRTAWEALAEARLGGTASEAEGLRFRRSLYVVEDVRAGDVVSPSNVRSSPPGRRAAARVARHPTRPPRSAPTPPRALV